MTPPKKSRPEAAEKEKKAKLVRDSFTIPKNEYAAIDALKLRALTLGIAIKKSELLRAGLMALTGLSDARLKSALAAVPTLKTGRPSAQSQAAEEKPAEQTAEAAQPSADQAKPARKRRVKAAEQA